MIGSTFNIPLTKIQYSPRFFMSLRQQIGRLSPITLASLLIARWCAWLGTTSLYTVLRCAQRGAMNLSGSIAQLCPASLYELFWKQIDTVPLRTCAPTQRDHCKCNPCLCCPLDHLGYGQYYAICMSWIQTDVSIKQVGYLLVEFTDLFSKVPNFIYIPSTVTRVSNMRPWITIYLCMSSLASCKVCNIDQSTRPGVGKPNQRQSNS